MSYALVVTLTGTIAYFTFQLFAEPCLYLSEFRVANVTPTVHFSEIREHRSGR
ncbi:hypothetical protein Pla8534_35430 [Lignipirellula cremea]|uniref:Uncharacterized protein n=1 Tax=Lignipirellula cremea TaxID=2528010 RepID=A0A518DV58_9BACT|nr:hypothetical protein Pla8534_35430 [Lignipirellula cremea]